MEKKNHNSENQAATEIRYKIPQDLIMDILRILFGNNIKHRIEGVKEKENTIQLKVYWLAQHPIHKKAKENIEILLNTYAEDMEGILNDHTLIMDKED